MLREKSEKQFPVAAGKAGKQFPVEREESENRIPGCCGKSRKNGFINRCGKKMVKK